ncbi:MAG: hypothetical protein ACR2LK_16515 [Solirubrobacteraceae bacterium]
MLDQDSETDQTADVDPAEDGLVDAVDDRAAELTGGEGAQDTDAPVASNSGAVANAEAHLEETDLADDREVLKKLQGGQ